MIFNTKIKQEAEALTYKVKILISEGALVECDKKKFTRTNSQNAARWLYLSQISEILNERGETFNPIGTTLDVPFTKDNLYQLHWQSLRGYMFPGKQSQLDTKEFSSLVEMVQMLFAKVFDISIPFPDMKIPQEKIN